MENALKALLIAAGMFFAILIMTALVFFYNQVSSFYKQQHEFAVIEQAQDFNARFDNYNRDNIRGSDLISLMNRVIDYNTTESYFDGTGYERLLVTIDLVPNGYNEEDILNQFKYDGEAYENEYLKSVITNTTGTGTKWQNDRNLKSITNTSADLCAKLGDLGIARATDTKLQQLSSNISNIIINETESWNEYYRFKRVSILKDILGIDINVDANTGITKYEDAELVENIKNITSQYYQYTQFKRACFNCIEMKYDSETDRVIEINFEVKLEDGQVVFD